MKPETQQTTKNVQVPPSQNKTMVHNLEPMKEKKVTINIVAIIIGVVIVASGGLTGYVLAKGGTGSSSTTQNADGTTTTTGGTAKKIVGVTDDKVFKDSAEGILRDGGTDSGEGTHHLERPGGISQTVYLTSSTIDMSEFIDKRVKVQGETFAAKTAGWFMDVGRLELLE